MAAWLSVIAALVTAILAYIAFAYNANWYPFPNKISELTSVSPTPTATPQTTTALTQTTLTPTATPNALAPPDPYIPSLDALVTELLLFESAYDAPLAEQRVYTQRFASDTTRYINWELRLEHPAPGHPIDFEITAIWYQDNGTPSWEEILRHTLDTSVEADWTWSYHWFSYGCGDPVDCWEVGSYRVDIYVEGKKIASEQFEIY